MKSDHPFAYNREQAIALAEKIRAATGERIVFEGFGGSTSGTETLVWTLDDDGTPVEIRTPQADCLLSLSQIESEYGCIANETLEWAIAEYRERD